MKKCVAGSVDLIDSNILLVNIAAQQLMDVEHVLELQSLAKELIHKSERCLYSIINYGEYTLPSKAAREQCILKYKAEGIAARAIVVSDLGQLIIAKHSSKQFKSNIPTKIFMCLNEAKDWVKSLHNQHVYSR